MQHLTISHQRDIWRKTLQLQVAFSELSAGGHCEAPLPLLALSSEKLEPMLVDLSQLVGIHENLLSDEGHTFGYTVKLQFLKIFKQQAEGLHFTPYPDSPSAAFHSSTRASVDEPSLYFLSQSASHGHGGDTPSEDDQEFSPSRLRNVAGDSHGGAFLISSEWVPFVHLQPRVDHYIAEQRALLRQSDKTSDSSGLSPDVSFLTGNARRATVKQEEDHRSRTRATLNTGKQASTVMQERRAIGRKQSGGSALGAYEVHVTDMTLLAQLNLLKETDAKETQASLCAHASKVAAFTFPLMAGQAGTAAAASSSSSKPTGSGAAATVAVPATDSGGSGFSMPPEHMIQSYYLLRYLRSRELRGQLLHLLNVYRFAQRKVSHAILASQIAPNLDLTSGGSHSSAPHDGFDRGSFSGPPSRTKNDAPSLPSVKPLLPFKMPGDAQSALEMLAGTEQLLVQDGKTIVVDVHGLEIMHEVAHEDLRLIEGEILEIGSHFIRRAEEEQENVATSDNVHQAHKVDRASVLSDLLQAEVHLHQAKWDLLAPHLEIFEHTVDPAGRHMLAQRIVDIMAHRPRLDLDAGYFAEAYASCIGAVQERSRLLRMTLDHQIRTEKRLAADMAARAEQFGDEVMTGGIGEEDEAMDPQLHLGAGLSNPNEGLPGCRPSGLPIRLVPTIAGDCKESDLLDFYHSANLAWHVDALVESLHGNFCERFEPHVRFHALSAHACVMTIAAEWKREVYKNPVHLYTASSSHGDIFGYEAMEDPACLMLLVEDTMKDMPGIFCDEQPETKDTKPAAVGQTATEKAELRSAFSDFTAYSQDERTLMMYSNLLEHVIVRRSLTDVVLEMQFLESTLTEQGKSLAWMSISETNPLASLLNSPQSRARLLLPKVQRSCCSQLVI
jgi:hypothetical protein